MAQIFETLGIHPIQILSNAIGFVLLYWLLVKFLFGPIQSMLSARQEQVQSDLQQAAAQREEMEQRQGELASRLANLESEVRDRIQAAEREAKALREQQLKEAQAERERIVETGLAELHREREKALVEIRNLVADLAMLAAGKVIEEELDLDAHRAMIDDIVEHGVQ